MKSYSRDFGSVFYHILQHRNTPTRLSRLFCITKVPLLHSKKDYNQNANEVLLHCKRSLNDRPKEYILKKKESF